MSPTFFITMVANTAGKFDTIEEFKAYLLEYVTNGYPFLYYGDDIKCERAVEQMRKRIDSLVKEFADVVDDYYGKAISA